MNITVRLITTLALILAADSGFANSTENKSYDGTGAAEMALVEAHQAQQMPVHPGIKSIEQDIEKVRSAAREVGYFDGYMLFQDVMKGRKTTGFAVETAAQIKKMSAKKNAALKTMNDILKKSQSDQYDMKKYSCQDSWKNFIQQEQSAGFLTTASTSANSIGSSETEKNSWKYSLNMWSKGHSKELEEKIVKNCIDLE